MLSEAFSCKTCVFTWFSATLACHCFLDIHATCKLVRARLTSYFFFFASSPRRDLATAVCRAQSSAAGSAPPLLAIHLRSEGKHETSVRVKSGRQTNGFRVYLFLVLFRNLFLCSFSFHHTLLVIRWLIHPYGMRSSTQRSPAPSAPKHSFSRAYEHSCHHPTLIIVD